VLSNLIAFLVGIFQLLQQGLVLSKQLIVCVFCVCKSFLLTLVPVGNGDITISLAALMTPLNKTDAADASTACCLLLSCFDSLIDALI
jgi:hypothetical protein